MDQPVMKFSQITPLFHRSCIFFFGLLLNLSVTARAGVIDDYRALLGAIAEKGVEAKEQVQEFLQRYPESADVFDVLQQSYQRDPQSVAFHFNFVFDVVTQPSLENTLGQIGFSDYLLSLLGDSRDAMKAIGMIYEKLSTDGMEVASFNSFILDFRRMFHWFAISVTAVSAGYLSTFLGAGLSNGPILNPEQLLLQPEQLAIKYGSLSGMSMAVLMRFMPKKFNLIDIGVKAYLGRRIERLESLLTKIYCVGRSVPGLKELGAKFVIALATKDGDAHDEIRLIARRVIRTYDNEHTRSGMSSFHTGDQNGMFSLALNSLDAGDFIAAREDILEFGEDHYVGEQLEGFTADVEELSLVVRKARNRDRFLRFARFVLSRGSSLGVFTLGSYEIYRWSGSKFLAFSTLAMTSALGMKFLHDLTEAGRWIFGFGAYNSRMQRSRAQLSGVIGKVLRRDPEYASKFFSHFAIAAVKSDTDFMTLLADVIEKELLAFIEAGSDIKGHARNAILDITHSRVVAGSFRQSIEGVRAVSASTIRGLCKLAFSAPPLSSQSGGE